jgi:hypothetical protein
MITISEKEYNQKPNDYKSIYSSDSVHGTNLDGRRTLLHWEEGLGTCLLIEGESLIITK